MISFPYFRLYRLLIFLLLVFSMGLTAACFGQKTDSLPLVKDTFLLVEDSVKGEMDTVWIDGSAVTNLDGELIGDGLRDISRGLSLAQVALPKNCGATEGFPKHYFWINFPMSFLLALFVVITCITFLSSRLKRKESDFERIISVFDIVEKEAGLLRPSVADYFRAKDYIFPVAFCFSISLAGFLSIFVGTQVSLTRPILPNAFYTGTVLSLDSTCELIMIKLEGLRVIGYGFIGAFIWGAQIIIRRLIAGDLTPGVYYNVSFRMILAPILAILVLFGLRGIEINGRGWPMDLIPIMAVLTGLFPEQALAWLKERVFIFANRKNRNADALPLDMIEGINIFHKSRLSELGIDNAQNLAKANLIDLLIRTPYEPRQLIDWIAQARLYIYLKEDIVPLRQAGVRTIFDLSDAIDTEEEVEALSATTGVDKTKLKILAGRFQSDANLQRLKGFEEKLTFG